MSNTWENLYYRLAKQKNEFPKLINKIRIPSGATNFKSELG